MHSKNFFYSKHLGINDITRCSLARGQRYLIKLERQVFVGHDALLFDCLSHIKLMEHTLRFITALSGHGVLIKNCISKLEIILRVCDD